MFFLFSLFFPSLLFFLCSLSSLSAKINDIVMATYRVMKSKLPSTLQSMSLYLANRDTEFILFKPVRVGGRESRCSTVLKAQRIFHSIYQAQTLAFKGPVGNYNKSLE